MQRSLLLLAFGLLSSRLIVSAQDTVAVSYFSQPSGLRIGIGVAGFSNFTHWQTSAYIDGRYRLRPYLSKSFRLLAQERLTNRLTLEAGLSYTQLGLASSIAKNYIPGRRYSSLSTSRSQYNMLMMSFQVLYYLREQNSLKKYILLGANVYFNDVVDKQFSRATTTTWDTDTGDTLIIDERRRTLTKFSPAVVVGGGWEKCFSKRSSINVRAVVCIGLAPIVQTFSTFTILNQSRYYTPYSSTNELINRGTYASLELCYLFSFR